MAARLAALLAIAALLGGCASPTPRPSSSPAASSASSLQPLEGWQQIELPLDDPRVRLTTAVATAGGFVTAGGSGAGVVGWSSVDGQAWVEETIPGEMSTPTDAVAWGDRVLMVGIGGFAPRCGHPSAITTWIRDGSGTWSQAPFQQDFCAGGSASAAVAGGLAVIVVAGTGDVPYAWSSRDGLHWDNQAGAFRDVGLPLMALATPGGFVALGVGEDGAWFERSPDGLRWGDLVDLPSPPTARPIGATVVGSSLVVILGEPEGTVVRLSSEDGTTWIADPVSGLVASSINRVEAIEGGLVAIGGDDQGPALWASGDGLAWRRVGLPESARGGYIADVAVGHGRAVVLGGAATLDGRIAPSTWVGPDSLLAP